MEHQPHVNAESPYTSHGQQGFSQAAVTAESPYTSHGQQQYSQAAGTAQAALQQPAPNPTNRKRKASGVPGSRGVAHLNPDQLAKKRANDREAQRAIRERTRNTIESLEQRIKELESQQPYQELQKVVQERDRALVENEELRKKLATVASVASVIGGQQQAQQAQQPNLHELATLTAQQSPLPSLNTVAHAQYSQSPGGQHYDNQQQILHPDLRSPQNATQSSSDNQAAAGGSTYQADNTSLRKWSPNLDQPTNSHYSPSHRQSHEYRLPPPAGMQTQSNGERLGINYVLEPTKPSISSPTEQSRAPYISQSASEKPIFARVPVNSAPDSPLDYLLVDFLSNRKAQLAAGTPLHEVAGPEYPAFIALKDPSLAHDSHPLSALLIDILSKFPDIAALPERVAVLYIMFLVLRWEICPCETCYYRLPEWMRPLKEQLDTPHPAWYDHLPWPIMRLRLITTVEVQFENFFIPFTSRQCLNWPYPPDQVLIPAGDTDDQADIKLNPVFESHIRNLNNWSLGTLFRTSHPNLIDDTVKIQDRTPS